MRRVIRWCKDGHANAKRQDDKAESDYQTMIFAVSILSPALPVSGLILPYELLPLFRIFPGEVVFPRSVCFGIVVADVYGHLISILTFSIE
jgi:hypothetical protein